MLPQQLLVIETPTAFRHTSAAVGSFRVEMRIHVIKTPPAPLMDGFDVRDVRANHIYEIDSRTANYLIIAGYAVCADDESCGFRKF